MHLEFLPHISALPREEWNALSGVADPFLRHEFLAALENSASVCPATGWQPCHLVLRRATGEKALAVMPLYLKSHSWGEYVFDWAWANAYHERGQRYYPKLVSAIPFTPVSGARLCHAAPDGTTQLFTAAREGVLHLAQEASASCWQVLFPAPEEAQTWLREGLLLRRDCQFHWYNDNYRDFEHFLQHCNSRHRKKLRKERQRIAAEQLRFEHIPGAEIDAALWGEFYGYYQSSYHKRGQQAYLRESFFHELGQSMPEQLLLVRALQNDKSVAGALFFLGADSCYGRYWGCREEYNGLHFETCYYQGIELCIARQLRHFDAGAQGEHKLQRGFRPITTFSAHWIADPAFRRALGDFLAQEARTVRQYADDAREFLPFKVDSG